MFLLFLCTFLPHLLVYCLGRCNIHICCCNMPRMLICFSSKNKHLDYPRNLLDNLFLFRFLFLDFEKKLKFFIQLSSCFLSYQLLCALFVCVNTPRVHTLTQLNSIVTNKKKSLLHLQHAAGSTELSAKLCDALGRTLASQWKLNKSGSRKMSKFYKTKNFEKHLEVKEKIV